MIGIRRNLEKRLLDAIADRSAFIETIEPPRRNLRRRAETGDIGDRFRAAAMAAFLPAAGNQRHRHHQIRRRDESANTLGSADLVRRNYQVITATICNIDGKPPQCLNRIDNEYAAGRLHQRIAISRIG
jgi:hypothetical protein